jgi:hypothetical protein
MKKYRISNNRDEIVNVLQKKFAAENNVTIWQKDPKSETRVFICVAKFNSLNTYEGIFSVEIEEKHRVNFNPILETYFLLPVHDFVFKTKSSFQLKSNNDLVFQIPREVRLQELRNQPREYIKNEDKIYVSAAIEEIGNKISKIQVECPVFNISKTGICIIISKETLCNVKLNKSFSISGLSFFKLFPDKQSVVVKNARVLKTKKYSVDDQFAIGLEFVNDLSSELN